MPKTLPTREERLAGLDEAMKIVVPFPKSAERSEILAELTQLRSIVEFETNGDPATEKRARLVVGRILALAKKAGIR